ncbi:MAG: hypothetical protein RL339_1465 [Pseudomonadota bacterium]|jgi:uncharacterized protein (DUF885 family)
MGLGRALLLASLAFGVLAPARAQPIPSVPVAGARQDEDGRLLAMLNAFARAQETLDPLGAVARGDNSSPQQLQRLFSDELAAAQRAELRRQLAALTRINRARLSPERQLSYDAFQQQTREALGWLSPDIVALTAVRPFNHFGGLHEDFPALIGPGGALPYRDERDYRRNLALLRAFPVVLDRTVGRFRQGMASGVVETRLTTVNMIAQLDEVLARPPEDSIFAAPLAEMPEAIPAARQALIRSDWQQAVSTEIVPAYRRLRQFLAEEYLPVARAEPGLAAMKGGAGLYRRLILRHTTLPLEPDAIHALGQAEVARIQAEMEQVKAQLGFKGTLAAFFNQIRTDPRFHPKTAAELGDGYARVARAVDTQLPRLFARQPIGRMTIAAYPASRGKFEAGGSYSLGSADGRRPGVFYYNTYDLESRFLSGVTTLYLHEGIPGHHFQTSLAQQDLTLPDFQRFGDNAAYVEGWALYAETLGYEMGLYADPLQHWGTLDDEMLRAMRLVVDTGLHAKGWSRSQAVAYMLANSGMGRSDAEAEVDRYIANPGQALSYKIGAMTIQRLRREAEAALGPRVDLKAFHEQLLGSGVLPLPMLETKVRRWIAAGR